MNDILRDSSLAAPRAVDLLQHYQPGSTLFASSRQTLLAEGVDTLLPQADHASMAAEAMAHLAERRAAGERRPVALGALPFRPDAPARLWLPRTTLFGQGVEAAEIAHAPAQPGGRRAGTVTALPSPQRYQDNVTRALAAIAAGEFEKVVLSRSLQVEAQIDLAALLQRLARRNPIGYTFAFDLADRPASRTLIGASPELLLARRGRRVVSHPLAGSIPRSADPVEDARRAAGLLRSAKDRHEHALVVDAVAAALRPFCRELTVPAEPTLLSTPTMWHLGTEVAGQLDDPTVSSLQLALALHPTPAVCGHPTAPARDFIQAVEGFDRGLFTGLIGWCSDDGDGEWAVTIRCAEAHKDRVSLYAGAGIVAGSDPALELAETAAKLRTMLNAMDLESALEQQL
ncbi:isochorismate synthase [Chitinimonas lacunae]|uniref:isochorismate synthase n=1 Tax=Chitinimonas lacunae TaxID=1963018 RepID=A0ABV8MKL0_9NEIS